ELEGEAGEEAAVEWLPERAVAIAGGDVDRGVRCQGDLEIAAVVVLLELVGSHLRVAWRRAARDGDALDLGIGHHERARLALMGAGDEIAQEIRAAGYLHAVRAAWRTPQIAVGVAERAR